jgi:hypothetical protein
MYKLLSLENENPMVIPGYPMHFLHEYVVGEVVYVPGSCAHDVSERSVPQRRQTGGGEQAHAQGCQKLNMPFYS